MVKRHLNEEIRTVGVWLARKLRRYFKELCRPVLSAKGMSRQAKLYSIELIFIIGQFVLWSA
jgi:uncharacterized membrane protein YbaN (DUF454 family)